MKTSDFNFKEVFEAHKVGEEQDPIDVLLEDQYKQAYDTLTDAYDSGLYVGIVGPVGCGKTAICRKFAQEHDVGFSWVTFSDLIRPSTLIGTFDPTLVFKLGYSIDSFIPGPFTQSALNGTIFFANEINRGDEYVLNSLLDALEEKRLYIPQLKTWVFVDKDFFFIAAMNPEELRGTRILPSAFKDRISVWITLDYPKPHTEKKIIKINVPEINLKSNILDLIIDIVKATRDDKSIIRPASIRASLAFAKLLGQRASRLDSEPDKTMIKEVGKLVLGEMLEFTPGIDGNNYLEQLLVNKIRNFKDKK